MKTTILLDLDGPLGDCVGDVLERYGVPRAEQRTRVTTYDALTEFLAERTRNGPKGAVVVPAAPWYRIGNDFAFWAKMTEQPWAARLIEHCRNLAETVVCTKAVPYPGCAAGKLAWCLDRKLTCTIVSGASKAALASPWHLLVDDAEHQVEAFRTAGGRAILWPAPWNSRGPLDAFGGGTVSAGFDRVLAEIADETRTLVDVDDFYAETRR